MGVHRLDHMMLQNLKPPSSPSIPSFLHFFLMQPIFINTLYLSTPPLFCSVTLLSFCGAICSAGIRSLDFKLHWTHWTGFVCTNWHLTCTFCLFSVLFFISTCIRLVLHKFIDTPTWPWPNPAKWINLWLLSELYLLNQYKTTAFNYKCYNKQQRRVELTIFQYIHIRHGSKSICAALRSTSSTVAQGLWPWNPTFSAQIKFFTNGFCHLVLMRKGITSQAWRKACDFPFHNLWVCPNRQSVGDRFPPR